MNIFHDSHIVFFMDSSSQYNGHPRSAISNERTVFQYDIWEKLNSLYCHEIVYSIIALTAKA